MHIYIYIYISFYVDNINLPRKLSEIIMQTGPCYQSWMLCDPQTDRLSSPVSCNSCYKELLIDSENMKQLTTMLQVFKVFPHIAHLDYRLTLVDIIKHISSWDSVWCDKFSWNIPTVSDIGFEYISFSLSGRLIGYIWTEYKVNNVIHVYRTWQKYSKGQVTVAVLGHYYWGG